MPKTKSNIRALKLQIVRLILDFVLPSKVCKKCSADAVLDLFYYQRSVSCIFQCLKVVNGGDVMK